MADFEIIEGGPERVEAAIEAYGWLFAPPGSEPPGWDPQEAAGRWLAAAASDDALTLLAVGGRDSGGGVVGICTAYIDLESVRFGRRCWIEDLAVDPSQRSQGIGAALLERARRWGRGHGATHLELDSGEQRTEAHRFYERERPDWRSNQYTWLLDR